MPPETLPANFNFDTGSTPDTLPADFDFGESDFESLQDSSLPQETPSLTGRFAQRSALQTGALMPAMPTTSLKGAALDTLKILPNLLSDTWNLAKEMTYGTAKRVVYDIPKETYGLIKDAGLWDAYKGFIGEFAPSTVKTVWGLVPEAVKQLGGKEEALDLMDSFQKVYEESGNSWSKAFSNIMDHVGDVDLSKKNMSRALSNVVSEVPNSLTDYLDNLERARISVTNAPLSETLAALGFKMLVEGAMNPAKLKTNIQDVTTATENVFKDTTKGLADPTAFVTSPFRYISDLYSKYNKKSIMDKSVQNAQTAVDSVRKYTDIDEQLNSVPKFSEEYNRLISERDQLIAQNEKAVSQAKSDADYSRSLLEKDLQDNSFKDSQEAAQHVSDIVKVAKSETQELYNKSFSKADGSPIYVDTSSAIKPMETLLREAVSAGDRKVFESLRNEYADLVVRKVLQEVGGDIGKITTKNLEPYKEFLPSKFIEPSGWPNYDTFGDVFYQKAITADYLKQYRNKIHDIIGENGGLLKKFDEVSNALNKSLEESVTKENPDAWKMAERADSTWKGIKESEIAKTASAQNASPEKILKKVQENWDEFVARYENIEPELVDRMRNMIAENLIKESIKKDGSFDYQKFGNLIEENKTVIGNQIYAQMSSVKDIYKNVESLDIKNQAKQITEEAKKMKEGAQITGDDLSLKASEIKTEKQLADLKKATNLDDSVIGAAALKNLYERHSFKIGKGFEDMKMEDIDSFIKDYEKIGSKNPQIREKMFAEIDPIMQELKRASEEYKKASVEGKGIARRVAKVALAGIAYAFSHPGIATYLVLDAVKFGGKKIPESPNISTAMSTPAVTGAAQPRSTNLKNALTIGSAQVRLEDYLNAAQEIMGGELSEEDRALLEAQFNENFGPGV